MTELIVDGAHGLGHHVGVEHMLYDVIQHGCIEDLGRDGGGGAIAAALGCAADVAMIGGIAGRFDGKSVQGCATLGTKEEAR